jgi:hypothetical protein
MAFEDGSVSFCIRQGATLADISENLDKVGKWHGKLLSVDVRFNAPAKSGFGRSPEHPLLSSSVSQLARAPDHLTAQFDHSAWLQRL